MFVNLKRNLFLCVGSTALLMAGACGDDDDKATPDATPVVFDAGVADAAPDAAPDPTFSGSLALADLVITNPEGVAGAVAGGAAIMSFTDPLDVEVGPHPDFTNNVGECRVFVYDVANGDAAPDGSDGGDVTVTGTNAGDILCEFGPVSATESKYVCHSTDAAYQGALPIATAATPTGNDITVAVTIAGADFSNAPYLGMHVLLSGFPDAAANGLFPIMAIPADNTLVVYNPALTATSTLIAAGTYSTVVGGGPIPGGYDFLDDGTNDIAFAKDAITNVPVVATTLKANGDGATWLDPSPHEFPFVSTDDVTFACTGFCGTAEGLLKGVVIFGETTDADVTGLAFNEMPDATSKYATFQCSGVGQEAMTITKEALVVILGTNPTRIQTTVIYSNAALATGHSIVMGHGRLGFTDAPE